MTGIYQIKSKINSSLYIGSALNINNRWNLHKASLNNNKHHSIYLQRHCNKYGIDDLEFSIIELCIPDDLLIKEQFYLDKFNPKFNVQKVAHSSLGVKRRPETIEKIRKANLGLKHPEWRNEIKSKSQGGENHWTKTREKPFSEESKKKMSESQKNLYKNGYVHPNKKAILQFDMEDNFIKEWGSVQEAINVYGKGISNNLTKKNKSAYGFKWKFKK